MKKGLLFKLFLMGLALTISFGLAVSCASDDDDDDDNDTSNTVTFSGQVLVFGASTETPMASVPLQLVDNTTGTAIAGATATSAGDGTFSISYDKPDVCKVGIKSTGNGDTTHTSYQFNLDCDSSDEVIWSVTQTLWLGAPAMAGLTQEAGKGVVAGAVYWVNDSNEEEPVGCATINAYAEASTIPVGDSAYMNQTGLPAPITDMPETYPYLGYYIVANVPAGDITTKATLGEVELEADAVTFPAFADAVCISNIYISGSANPTTQACKDAYQ